MGSSPLVREGSLEAAELVRIAFSQAVRSWSHLPETLEINDPALAGDLLGMLAGTGVSVEVEEELAALDSVFATLVESLIEGEAPPGLLSGEGVTVEAAAAFARAARRFHEAAPWRFLGPGAGSRPRRVWRFTSRRKTVMIFKSSKIRRSRGRCRHDEV